MKEEPSPVLSPLPSPAQAKSRGTVLSPRLGSPFPFRGGLDHLRLKASGRSREPAAQGRGVGGEGGCQCPKGGSGHQGESC